MHTTVKFSDQEDRDNNRGYTVHIYNDADLKYDPSREETWSDRSPDSHRDQAVYYNRTEAPPTKYYTLCHKWPYLGQVEISSLCILEAIRNYHPS